jgi:hypothetical protein
MLRDVADKIARLEGRRDTLLTNQKRLETEISCLSHRTEVLNKASEAIRFVLQSLVESDKEGIQAVLSEGLKAIFDDQELEMRINTSIKRGKVNVDFNVYDGLKGVEGNVLDSFGGGIANVVSLLFRCIIIMKLGLRKIIVLDESLSNIADFYVDNTGRFLKSFCDKTGFDILLVTHQPKFLEWAHSAYEGGINGSEFTISKVERQDNDA